MSGHSQRASLGHDGAVKPGWQRRTSQRFFLADYRLVVNARATPSTRQDPTSLDLSRKRRASMRTPHLLTKSWRLTCGRRVAYWSVNRKIPATPNCWPTWPGHWTMSPTGGCTSRLEPDGLSGITSSTASTLARLAAGSGN